MFRLTLVAHVSLSLGAAARVVLGVPSVTWPAVAALVLKAGAVADSALTETVEVMEAVGVKTNALAGTSPGRWAVRTRTPSLSSLGAA